MTARSSDNTDGHLSFVTEFVAAGDLTRTARFHRQHIGAWRGLVRVPGAVAVRQLGPAEHFVRFADGRPTLRTSEYNLRVVATT